MKAYGDGSHLNADAPDAHRLQLKKKVPDPFLSRVSGGLGVFERLHFPQKVMETLDSSDQRDNERLLQAFRRFNQQNFSPRQKIKKFYQHSNK